MNKNTIKTFALLAGFGGLLMVIGSFFGQAGLLIGLALGLAMVGGSYWFSDKLAVASAHAHPIDEQDAPDLYAMVRDLARRADAPMPRVYLSPEPQPNAFATGRSPKRAVVCVTRGLLQVLEPDEVRAVLAHEMSHVKNHDILIGSVAAALAMAVTFVARMAMWGAVFGGGGSDRENGNVFGALLLAVLAPVAAVVIQMGISRSREFEADHSGAELLGSGESLARALEKIETYTKQVPMDVAPALATAYIVNPLTGRQVQFANLFRTHPPTADRIARLRG